MSIDFGTDIYEEPLVAKTLLPEDNAEVSLRPHTLAEYIGQTKAKENLSVFIEAARRRTEPLDHVLLHGPPGPKKGASKMNNPMTYIQNGDYQIPDLKLSQHCSETTSIQPE